MKNSLIILSLLILSGCFVSKKKYDTLEQEIASIKQDLKDEDKDGVPNYLDLELQTDSLAKVDAHGRTERIVKIVDMDEDGILDVNDFCPTIKGIASANGCPDRDGDGIYDFLDSCKHAAGLKENNGCPVIKDEGCKFPHRSRIIQFEHNKIEFTENTKEFVEDELIKISKTMLENPTYELFINGHTSKMKDSIKSNKLSLKRAQLIKYLLIKKGVPESQLFIIAKGNSDPVCPKDEKESKKYDDRITFIIKFNEE